MRIWATGGNFSLRAISEIKSGSRSEKPADYAIYLLKELFQNMSIWSLHLRRMSNSQV